jgi:hypothetical protein
MYKQNYVGYSDFYLVNNGYADDLHKDRPWVDLRQLFQSEYSYAIGYYSDFGVNPAVGFLAVAELPTSTEEYAFDLFATDNVIHSIPRAYTFPEIGEIEVLPPKSEWSQGWAAGYLASEQAVNYSDCTLADSIWDEAPTTDKEAIAGAFALAGGLLVAIGVLAVTLFA